MKPTLALPMTSATAQRMAQEFVEELQKGAERAHHFQFIALGVDGTGDFLLLAAPSKDLITPHKTVVRISQVQALAIVGQIGSMLASAFVQATQGLGATPPAGGTPE